MNQRRVPDRCGQGEAVRSDADVLALRYVGRHVTQNRSHFELMRITVVTKYFAVLLADGLIRGHQSAIGSHPGARGDTPGLERQTRLVHLAEDVVHRVADSPRDRAVDGRGGGLVLPGTGIRSDPARRDCTLAQRP